MCVVAAVPCSVPAVGGAATDQLSAPFSLPLIAGSSGSPDMEVSVAPAPGPDGDILVVSSAVARRGSGCGGGSAEDEMSDMMNDAVLVGVDFEAAEQLVELQRQLEQQLTLGDGEPAGEPAEPAAGAAAQAAAAAPPANGRAEPAAAGKAGEEEEVPNEFLANQFWKASFDVGPIDELQS